MNHMPDMPSYQRSCRLIDRYVTHSAKETVSCFEAHYPFKRIDYVFATNAYRASGNRTPYEGEFVESG